MTMKVIIRNSHLSVGLLNLQQRRKYSCYFPQSLHHLKRGSSHSSQNPSYNRNQSNVAYASKTLSWKLLFHNDCSRATLYLSLTV